MRWISITGVVWAALVLYALTPPSVSMAADYTFYPQIVSSQGDLELNMTSQTTEYTQGDNKTTSTGTFYRETLNLAADGYVYHPRFQIFLTKLSGVLDEGSNTGSTIDTSRYTTSTLNYELRTIFLPEHPYNLELFTLHRKETTPGTFWQGQSGTVDESGAIFKYKQVPYSGSASYDDISLESSNNTTDTKTYRAQVAYHTNVISHSAAYSYAVSDSSFDVRNTREIATYGNTLRLADSVLNSRVNETTTDQQKPLNPELQTRMFSWSEQLVTPLPWNFSSTLSFEYVDETDTTGEALTDQSSQEQFNRSITTSLNLSHRLYQSLLSNFSMNQMSLKSSSGDMSSWSDTFNSLYTKAIPSGMFTAGIQFSTASVERQGTPVIINEVHSAALLGSFTLTVQNIIQSTIQIQVKDPATGTLMTLPQSNYVVSQPGSNVQITITNVSPATLQPDPAYAYEFQVSYSLSDQSKIDMISEGYSLKLDLLNYLLSPYYSYFTSNQEVVSGSVAGGPDRNSTEITGIASQHGPYSGFVEHQRFRSRLNPSETWKTNVQYLTPIAENTHFSALLSYLRTDYFPVSSTEGSTEGFRQETWGTDVKLDFRFPQNNLNFFMAGSYSVTRSAVDSTFLSVNSYLTWQLGLLSVNAGVQLSRTESLQSTANVTMASQYYYVTLNRKLF